jgi:hypothetical protein
MKLYVRLFGSTDLYEAGVYRAEGKQGDAKPPSVSFIHRWLKEAEAAGLL